MIEMCVRVCRLTSYIHRLRTGGEVINLFTGCYSLLMQCRQCNDKIDCAQLPRCIEKFNIWFCKPRSYNTSLDVFNNAKTFPKNLAADFWNFWNYSFCDWIVQSDLNYRKSGPCSSRRVRNSGPLVYNAAHNVLSSASFRHSSSCSLHNCVDLSSSTGFSAFHSAFDFLLPQL